MEGTLLNGRYRLVELIGSGGMALVYKGVDTLLHRPVAIKILREAYASDPAFLARFQREARSAAQLDHPNIVTVYDVGQDGNLHYIVMEYVDGEDLKSIIRREGRLSVDRAVDIAIQIAAGVGHAHKMGIIHCDIKPQNILITRDGLVKVTDFGIARALSESGLTDPEVVWGSPTYFSPEQAAGERPVPASDVYSIGVVLYEMLAGVPPFRAEKPTALALMHLREEPPPLSVYNPRVPSQLEWIVRKLLAKEPSARYRTAEQLAIALQEYRDRMMQATGVYVPPGVRPSPPRPGIPSRPEGAPPPPSRAGVPPRREPTGPAQPAAIPEERGTDWLTWILGAIATIAVIGLIPLWALVYQAWSRSERYAPPAPTTPTATVALVPVPNVQGRRWEEARELLEAAGLRFVLEEQKGAVAPEGTVVRQEPPPGERVPAGTEVRLFVAGKPQEIEIPALVNVRSDLARSALEQAGFQVVEQVVWSTEPISNVLAQEPPPGARLPVGSVVTLTVSGGTAAPIPLQVNLGNIILLEQAEVLQARVRPGEVFAVSLRWRPLTTISTRYVVFIHLIGPDGRLIAQEDIEPLRGTRPTNTWVPQMPLWDPHQVTLPPDAPLGTYQVRTGMYPVGEPANRLVVVDPGLTSVEFNSILVARIEVRP
ncbi:MAG: Stk1 family PASTA domain-containing Ser/Thr kinase [Anaerolineae bacterium]|nr:Stk1 family PASTA domain-containing Ser/Thr kinase [Anaerolineae bacterium]MCX8066460.1 Stk1 family PASTA domain-containing Ser/Thr kinase [Anaerolineae bacterium]